MGESRPIMVDRARRSPSGDETRMVFGHRKNGRPTCKLTTSRDVTDAVRAECGDRCEVWTEPGGISLRRPSGNDDRRVAYNSTTARCRAWIHLDGAHDGFRERFGDADHVTLRMTSHGNGVVMLAWA